MLSLEELKQSCGASELIVDTEVAKVSVIGSGLGNSHETSAQVLSVLEDHSLYVKLLYCGEITHLMPDPIVCSKSCHRIIAPRIQAQRVLLK